MERIAYKNFKSELKKVRFINIDEQKVLCKQLMKTSLQHHDHYGVFVSATYLLDAAVALRDYQECQKYMYHALSHIIEDDIDELSQLYQLCGIYYYMINDNHTAIDYFCKVIHLCDQIHLEERKAATYNNIALVFNDCKDYSNALQYYQRAYDLMMKYGDDYRKRNLSIILGNIITCYQYLGDVDHALKYYEEMKSQDILKPTKKSIEACIYCMQGVHEKALECVKEAYQLIQQQYIDKFLDYEIREILLRVMLKIGSKENTHKAICTFYNVCNHDNIGEQLNVLRYYIKYADKFAVHELEELYKNYYLLSEANEKQLNEHRSISYQDQLLLDKMIELNRNLSTKAHYDSLTGLYNRNTFERHINHALSDEKIHTLSIMMCDVDNFKQHNDVYGHLYGDEILHTLGSILLECGDSEMYCYRYGGDEFLCLGINKTKEHMRDYVNQIYDHLKNHKEIHVSIGFASSLKDEVEDFTQLIEKADKALYLAKRSGKNHYEIFE